MQVRHHDGIAAVRLHPVFKLIRRVSRLGLPDLLLR